MKSRIAFAGTIVVVGLACGAYILVPARAKAPDEQPIVLSYADGPVFFGPHQHTVAAIAFSPDGKTLATGDGNLRLWDAQSGKLQSILCEDATRGISSLAFSPDGRRIAAVGAQFGKEAAIWDVASGRIIHDIDDPPASLTAPAGSSEAATMIYKQRPIIYHPRNAVAYSPDGRILATAGEGVALRDAKSWDVLATLKQPAKGVKAIAFSRDGKTLAAASEDKKVRLWSVPEGKLEATLSGATQPLTGVAISPDGGRIVAVGSGNRSLLDRTPEGFLWTWDRAGGAARKVEIAKARVQQVAFVGSARVVVAAGNQVLSVDLDQDEPLPRGVWEHSEEILAIAVSPDGGRLASGGLSRTVDVVELASGKLLVRLPGLKDSIQSVATSADGQRFATAAIDLRFSNRVETDDPSFAARYKQFFSGEANQARLQPSDVRIWTTASGKLQTRLELPDCQVTAVQFVPPGDRLVVAGWQPLKGGMLSLWDAVSGKHERDLEVHVAEVLALAVSADGKLLASGDAAGNLELWDARSGEVVRRQKLEHAIEALAFFPHGKLLAVGDAKRIVRLFDLAEGKFTRTMKSRSDIRSLAMSPGGTQLGAGTRDMGFELWDLRRDTPSRTLKATGDSFDNMPGFVAFSPDGRLVVCGGRGKNIAVFNASDGTFHGELKGHIHAPTAAAFLSDGRLVSGGEERTVRLWDMQDLKQLAMWITLPADGQQHWEDQWIGFAPGGEFVGSQHLDRIVGWQTGGEVIHGLEDTQHKRRVESLFSGKAEAAAR